MIAKKPEPKRAICTKAAFEKACILILGETEANDIKSATHRLNQAVFKIFEESLDTDPKYARAIANLRSALITRKHNGFFKFKDDE